MTIIIIMKIKAAKRRQCKSGESSLSNRRMSFIILPPWSMHLQFCDSLKFIIIMNHYPHQCDHLQHTHLIDECSLFNASTAAIVIIIIIHNWSNNKNSTDGNVATTNCTKKSDFRHFQFGNRTEWMLLKMSLIIIITELCHRPFLFVKLDGW